jgi:hypothetical protein
MWSRIAQVPLRTSGQGTLFFTPVIPGTYPVTGESAGFKKGREFANKVRDAFVNFARKGDPNHSCLPIGRRSPQ